MGSSTPRAAARLQIDERACVLSGVCASLAPHRFDLDGDRTVIIDDVAGPDDGPDAEAVDDAIACCPAAAISWADEDEAALASAPGRTAR
jgi:ferredoxin